jgi:uncharacterized protein YwgA
VSIVADIAAYFCENYPHKSELSKARLTKLVYLADWEASKRKGSQITSIKWYFHNFGPYVDDVTEEVSRDSRFNIVEALNFYGDKKTTIILKENVRDRNNLPAPTVEILNKVIEETRSMYWNEFINHVYATPPVSNSVRYSELDLVGAAKKYREALTH